MSSRSNIGIVKNLCTSFRVLDKMTEGPGCVLYENARKRKQQQQQLNKKKQNKT